MTKKSLGGRPRTRPKPKPFDRMVGSRVRVRRTIAKITPAEFARKIGRSLSQVYRLESGDTPLSDEILVRAAKVLGCSQADLRDGIHAK